jgi:hypothetical protein
MQFTLYGKTYNSTDPDYENIIELLSDEDTIVIYTMSDRRQVSKYDILLIINQNKKILKPMFLYMFKEIVNDFDEELPYYFPASSVIETSCIDFTICDSETITKMSNSHLGSYISYAEDGDRLFISIKTSYNFDSFTNKKHTTSMPVVKPAQPVQEDVPVVTDIPKPITVKPIIKKPRLPELINKETSRKNLFSFCNYSEDKIVIYLSTNRSLMFIDKKTGNMERYSIQELLNHELINFDSEAELVLQFGKTSKIPYDTHTVVLSDIRQIIKLVEEKKERSVTKQLLAYDNGTLYIALPAAADIKAHTSIKDFTINCHKASIGLYEKLKTKTQTFAKTLYCVETKFGIAILSVGSKSECNQLSIDQIYNAMPELTSVGDIIRCFPVDKIINGASIGISSPSEIRGFAVIPHANIDNFKNQYKIKNVTYAYEPQSKTIISAELPT